MANNSFTALDAARVTAAVAQKDAYLCSLVSRNYTQEFAGPGRGGATIQVKVPTSLIAHARDPKDHENAITMDNINETWSSVTLDIKMDYSAVPLSEWDLTLGLQDFSAQVLAPQCEAVVERLEDRVANLLRTAPEAEGITYDETDPVRAFTALRKALRKNGVSPSGLNVVVGPGIYEDLLNCDAIKDASAAGDNGALRNGNVGRLRGFTIVESNRLEDGEICAFHRDAVTLVTRAPAVPKGVTFGATVAEKGFSLRYTRDYDSKTAEDRSMVATFAGAAFLPTYQVVRTPSDGDTDGTVSVRPLAAGGALHLVHDYA